jgi:hypothetical protein
MEMMELVNMMLVYTEHMEQLHKIWTGREDNNV